MGQAKLRGTQEQRVAQAIEREALARAERDRKKAEADAAEAERIAALPPKQRERVILAGRNRNIRLATWMALAAAMGAPPPVAPVVIRTRRGKA